MTPRLNQLKTFLSLACVATLIVLLTGCQTTDQTGTSFQEYTPTVSSASSASKPATLDADPVQSTLPTSGSTPGQNGGTFQVGDVVSVTFSGTSEPIPTHEERIKEDGTITLSLVGSIQAKGKSAGDLQRELQKEYNKYYKTLVVTVASFQRVYYVGGEVKKPGAQVYLGETTVTQAIQAAGDFTDFAKKNKIKVIRTDGTSLTVNFSKALENPKLDPSIYPGDTIHVPRRLLW